MCLMVKRNWFRDLFKITPKLKVARKDIVVYKYLSQDLHGLISPIYFQRWRSGECYTSTPIVIKRMKRIGYLVETGFHSYTKPRPFHLGTHLGKLYNAIIPKGSRYIIGEEDCIVSNQLIITGKYND